jgi:hypothetical protein
MTDFQIGDRVRYRGSDEYIVCGPVKKHDSSDVHFVLVIEPSDHYRVSADWVDTGDVTILEVAWYAKPGVDMVEVKA